MTGFFSFFLQKQDPKLKRNATHAYISYMIYADQTAGRVSIEYNLYIDEVVFLLFQRKFGFANYFISSQLAPVRLDWGSCNQRASLD